MLPHYVIETLTNAQNSHMCGEDKSTPITDSVLINGARLQKLLRTYLEVVNCLLKKFVTK